ncbi:hypothetical protein CDD80_42 [Ophiocordyceps camponoti-rufipedis]|uniref:Uncharacterized protein n=1 Tax=Ophiocordyceps camponoti-rufipedis TaxID=2004952 RepID=A0A2C5ZJJ0_9HYPO|nr:hypothetical protein CDD80_42 [Ophiocordyceps camponoti-rufipedis]
MTKPGRRWMFVSGPGCKLCSSIDSVIIISSAPTIFCPAAATLEVPTLHLYRPPTRLSRGPLAPLTGWRNHAVIPQGSIHPSPPPRPQSPQGSSSTPPPLERDPADGEVMGYVMAKRPTSAPASQSIPAKRPALVRDLVGPWHLPPVSHGGEPLFRCRPSLSRNGP